MGAPFRISSVYESVPDERLADAALPGRGCHLVRGVPHVLSGVAHGDANAGVSEHFQVIVTVAHREGLPAGDA